MGCQRVLGVPEKKFTWFEDNLYGSLGSEPFKEIGMTTAKTEKYLADIAGRVLGESVRTTGEDPAPWGIGSEIRSISPLALIQSHCSGARCTFA